MVAAHSPNAGIHRICNIMKTKVFYELWEMECCGEPFKLGDNIEWYGISADRLVDALDIDGLEYVYDAHFDDWDGILKIKGVVSCISVYYEKYELISNSAHNMLKPVPGISEVISIDSSEEMEKDTVPVGTFKSLLFL